MLCLNATTGEKIWQLTMSYYYRTNIVMADSVIAVMNSYDQQIYAIGKGPSATTVSAPDISIDLGKSVMIKGTVNDVSPGTLDYALKARFPNGVAAVSDESVSAWMEYVYMQMPRPTNTVGVPVTIDVIDANGNYRNIGTATTIQAELSASHGNQTYQENTLLSPPSQDPNHTIHHMQKQLLQSIQSSNTSTNRKLQPIFSLTCTLFPQSQASLLQSL